MALKAIFGLLILICMESLLSANPSPPLHAELPIQDGSSLYNENGILEFQHLIDYKGKKYYLLVDPNILDQPACRAECRKYHMTLLAFYENQEFQLMKQLVPSAAWTDFSNIHRNAGFESKGAPVPSDMQLEPIDGGWYISRSVGLFFQKEYDSLQPFILNGNGARCVCVL